MATIITITCMAILTSIFCNYVEANNKSDKAKKGKERKHNNILKIK
jgi:hypothetical protein